MIPRILQWRRDRKHAGVVLDERERLTVDLAKRLSRIEAELEPVHRRIQRRGH